MSSDLSKPAMQLPPEVLARILAHLEKKDLKRVRLVCKKLERSAVSLLFDVLYLSTNPAEIEIMQNTVRNFGHSIKTVFFSAVVYRQMSWERFSNAVGLALPGDYTRLAYTYYRRLRQEQQAMFRAGTYSGHLCHALRTTPNTQRLIITDFESYSRPYEWTRRRSRLWRVGDCPAHCSIQGCAHGNLKHLVYMSDAQDIVPYTPRDINPWSVVMMGLAATGSYPYMNTPL